MSWKSQITQASRKNTSVSNRTESIRNNSRQILAAALRHISRSKPEAAPTRSARYNHPCHPRTLRSSPRRKEANGLIHSIIPYHRAKLRARGRPSTKDNKALRAPFPFAARGEMKAPAAAMRGRGWVKWNRCMHRSSEWSALARQKDAGEWANVRGDFSSKTREGAMCALLR